MFSVASAFVTYSQSKITADSLSAEASDYSIWSL